MSIIYILIPIAVMLTVLGIYLFFWAVKTEQFDDLEKQGMSILFDENEESHKWQVTSGEVQEDEEACELRSAGNEDLTANNEHTSK